MILDSSAVVAILMEEPEAEKLLAKLRQPGPIGIIGRRLCRGMRRRGDFRRRDERGMIRFAPFVRREEPGT
jgi:hypothetical protein